jgi:transposase InsO family protein
MRLEAIPARQKRRRFVHTTDSGHGLLVKENKPNQKFAAIVPDEKWVADITCLWTGEGWLYLAVVLDWTRGRCQHRVHSRDESELVHEADNGYLPY